MWSEQEGTGKEAFVATAVRRNFTIFFGMIHNAFGAHTRTNGGRNWPKIDRRAPELNVNGLWLSFEMLKVAGG